jgi:hypothetical protein
MITNNDEQHYPTSDPIDHPACAGENHNGDGNAATNPEMATISVSVSDGDGDGDRGATDIPNAGTGVRRLPSDDARQRRRHTCWCPIRPSASGFLTFPLLRRQPERVPRAMEDGLRQASSGDDSVVASVSSDGKGTAGGQHRGTMR